MTTDASLDKGLSGSDHRDRSTAANVKDKDTAKDDGGHDDRVGENSDIGTRYPPSTHETGTYAPHAYDSRTHV